MSASTEFLVSKSGQMSVPASVRRRWGLTEGGRVTVLDLGDAVVLLPAGARQKLLAEALSAEDHLAAAEVLGAAIAVSRHDVGPALRAAAEHDGVAFHVL